MLKPLAYIVVVLLALSAVIGAGAWMAARHYQPTIEKLNEKLSKCASLKDQADAGILTQNNAITALSLAGIARGLAAMDDYGKANEVLAERVDGPNACAAASSAFDAELARERVK